MARCIRTEGWQVKTILLTKGMFALVDDKDYERVNRFKWHARRSKQTFYAERNILRNGKMTKEGLHRFILRMGEFDGRMPDHRDGNGLNCQRYNLRIVTRKRNSRNRSKQANSSGKITSSQFKGVSWRKDACKWTAYITVDGRHKSLGVFAGDAAGERAAAL